MWVGNGIFTIWMTSYPLPREGDWSKNIKSKKKNQGKYLYVQLSLELLEFTIALGQSWMDRPKEMIPQEESIM